MELKTGEKTIKNESIVGENPKTNVPVGNDSSLNVEKKEVIEKDDTSITFKYNRKYDLHLGRKIITFMAGETKPIRKSLLKGEDWDQAKKLFIVKPIKKEPDLGSTDVSPKGEDK